MSRIFKIFSSLGEAFARMREVRQRGANPELKILETKDHGIVYFVFNYGLKALIVFGALYFIFS